ncbi:hypothetical protein KC685_00120 [Candidatus Dojkabacteria bacterium]|uniref:Nucleoside 2-deoxyribosyltransferase n=1 Tax=Candidatus Dojkabacteria bacterium TaxID=2099670 RepID=A0A955I0Z4_9BACT|nr:hypothetical protein [Candidatus Dojkabacteria bacterium]
MSIKIFYTASFYGKAQYQKEYDMVRESILKTGVDMISPELGGYTQVLSKRERDRLRDKNSIHYASIKRGIMMCDATVIEVSREDFQLGHEATLAIQAKKHVLCLSVNEDYSKKIKNPYFHGARYNRYNIDEVIGRFISKVDREGLSERFNFFLSPSQLTYISEQARLEGRTTADYLRGLIENDMG